MKYVEFDQRRLNGNVSSRWLKVVCGPCNNNWMSGLQTKVQNCLDSLAVDKWPRFSQRDQINLAAWITMHTMVIETIDPTMQATDEDERKLFRSTQKPLPNWRIWIGTDPAAFSRHWFHRGINMTMDLGSEPLAHIYFPRAATIPPKCNTQFTATLTGHLIAISCSSRMITLPNNLIADFPLRMLWPIRDRQLSKPPKGFNWNSVDLLMSVMTDTIDAGDD